ncbi:MAG TPA: hypothetical protein VF755_29140 [Catenuloplanes sp.]|jgi:hypothetical protein
MTENTINPAPVDPDEQWDPDGEVVCDLDAHEHPTPRPKPFWFRYQGQRFLLIDSMEADWQDLAVAQGNPRMMMHLLVPEDQRADLLSRKMPVYRLDKLIADYQAHYKLDLPDGPEPRR